MKFYDCFIYNNEDLILDIRFNILNQYVEKFVLVESRVDHQGNKKKLNFDKKKFKEFENKIEYLVVDNFPNDFSSWQRENYQRNYISEGLKNAKEDDYIIISDVDERLKNWSQSGSEGNPTETLGFTDEEVRS